MLTHLSIHDVVLIEKLDLPFHPGLTVLTGETGAGKSILLDSLGLALGERTAAGIIRTGAEKSSVTAVFELPPDHAVHDVLRQLDIQPPEPGEPLVLRRLVTRDGRSRAYICDQPVGVTVLRQVGARLVEIQGQHEQMGLMDASTHLELLDTFGTPPALHHKTGQAWDDWHAARTALDQARKRMQAAAREEDWLRQTVEDLEKLAPQEGEEEELAAQRVQLQQDERRGEAVAAAMAELNPRDRRSATPANALRAASRALARLMPTPLASEEQEETQPHQSQAHEALDALEKAEEALAEAETLLSRLAADTGTDARLLEETEERLFALRAEARKHNVTVNALPAYLADLRDQLNQLETGAEALTRLETEARVARQAFEKAAGELSAARQEAARALEKAVEGELRPLKLERARFIVQLAALPPESWNRQGQEQASFLIAANPGQPPGPLGKVASGGELSRLLLALKVVLAGRTSLTTLIFDEVDSGVGGATASAIGERLHRVAQGIQVLAITHSPQVAARGDQQLRIAKKISNGQTQTHAQALDQTERREELARMLAGDTVTEAARAAADSLLHPQAAPLTESQPPGSAP
ncbi:DNA repair protein RecN [Oecophyllibacter saccharovorans]|uniref:DNA repair protein RecN n=1 Tax=Oecophyllibacter saccharovorans TaxID=2558360 RepID=UPI0011745ABC|nr:DNA repair protein RecN [Oecophyllibacter saccharovorans]TPW34875.1 DNA repair protein RecN [Oecophyllibacter saccharovorans]